MRLPFDFEGVRRWEWWLSKVGIALLLFGVAFLFKFSWDQGWLQALLTPWVRVGLGTVLGCVLLALGLRIGGRRRSYSAVLLGGGIGTLYITSFAAYGVLDLVPHAAAFGAMVAVTALAFALSFRQDQPVLSLIATIGGLATPFVLYTEDGTVAGLVLYASLILAGTAGIYLYKGWRSLLAVSSVGTWAVLLAACLQLDPWPQYGAPEWAAQAGIVFTWLALWLVPAAREVLRGRDPASWPLPAPGLLARSLGDDGASSSAGLTYALSLGTPLLAVAFTGGIWSLDKQDLGLVALSGAGLYALATLLFRYVEREGHVSYVSGLSALALATLGVVLIFKGDSLFTALVLEAAALHLLARRLTDRLVSQLGHSLSGIVAAWLGYRLLAGVAEVGFEAIGVSVVRSRFLDVGTAIDLGAIALLPLVAHFALRGRVAAGYRFVASGALSLWLARELVALQDGFAYVVLAWTAYAVILFFLSRRFESVILSVAAQVQLAALSALVFGSLLYALAFGPDGIAGFNVHAIADLVALLVIGGFSLFVTRPAAVKICRVAAHAMLLTWFWGQLSSLPSGDAFVTIAWGLSGAALLVVGLRASFTDLVRLGLGTLFLVVGKLFLWDLAGVEAIWRVLLFLGFGGLFLLLSYYLQSLWRGGNGEGGIPGSRAA
jgi:hypothetical protein